MSSVSLNEYFPVNSELSNHMTEKTSWKNSTQKGPAVTLNVWFSVFSDNWTCLDSTKEPPKFPDPASSFLLEEILKHERRPHQGAAASLCKT